MIKTNCVVCSQPLLKTIERHEPGQYGWVSMTKIVSAFETLHPADENEEMTKLWCPHCGLLYDHEQL